MDEKKPFNLKKFIKKEGLTSARLKSLGLPRDLNLSVGNKPKKVYTPNLNVIRNKDKKKEIIRSKIEEAKKKQIKTKEKRTPAVAQYSESSGVFSEGVHGSLHRTSHRSTRNYNDYDSPATMSVPKIDKKNWTVSQAAEDSVVNDLLVKYEEDDSCSEHEQDMIPISFGDKCAVNQVPKVKNEVDIKVENDADDCKPDIYKSKFLGLHSSFINGKDVDDENPCVSLFKFPNSLSGKYFADNADDKNNDYRLNDINDGRVGKLVIRQSGKMEMHLGNTKYYINKDENFKIFEEIVYMPEEKSKENGLTKVTGVYDRYLMTPEWNVLLNGSCKI